MLKPSGSPFVVAAVLAVVAGGGLLQAAAVRA